MTVKKQPESSARELCETANDWFRQFLMHVEIFMAETGQALHSDSDPAELRLAAMRAVKLALRDSGADEEEIVSLFGRIAIEERGMGRVALLSPSKSTGSATASEKQCRLFVRPVK